MGMLVLEPKCITITFGGQRDKMGWIMGKCVLTGVPMANSYPSSSPSLPWAEERHADQRTLLAALKPIKKKKRLTCKSLLDWNVSVCLVLLVSYELLFTN